MFLGASLIGLGIVWYIVYAVIYNRYLPKDLPELVEQSRSMRPSKKRKRRREITVVMTESATPGWVVLFGIPPIPVVLLGLIVLVVSALINLFSA